MYLHQYTEEVTSQNGIELWPDETVAGYLAAFIDSEGCLYIEKAAGKHQYKCHAAIRLRDDDTPVLMRLQKRFGFGEIYRIKPQRSNKRDRPQASWHLYTHDACIQLIEILDKVPMQAKKAKDYEIWRQAVHLWGQIKRGGWSKEINKPIYDEMARLKKQLSEVRKYRVPDNPPEATVRPPKTTLLDKVVEVVNEQGKPVSTAEVRQIFKDRELPYPENSVAKGLIHQAKQGKIQQVDKGLYAPDPQS